MSNDGGRFLHDQTAFRYQPVYSPARQVMGEGQIIKFGIFPAQTEAKAPLSAQITVASTHVTTGLREKRGNIRSKTWRTNPAGTSNANLDLGCLVFKGRAQHC